MLKVLNSPGSSDITGMSYRLAHARSKGEAVSVAVLTAVLSIIKGREHVARCAYRRNRNRRLRKLEQQAERRGGSVRIYVGDSARIRAALGQPKVTMMSVKYNLY